MLKISIDKNLYTNIVFIFSNKSLDILIDKLNSKNKKTNMEIYNLSEVFYTTTDKNIKSKYYIRYIYNKY